MELRYPYTKTKQNKKKHLELNTILFINFFECHEQSVADLESVNKIQKHIYWELSLMRNTFFFNE